MVFILKHCDKAILRFSANEASSNPDYKIFDCGTSDENADIEGS